MSVILKGGASADLAGVTTDKELQTRATLFSENNAEGDGVGRVLLSPETTRDYRLRVGTDNLLWQQSWENAGNVNLYQNTYSFFTAASGAQALTAGYHRLNSSSLTASGVVAGIRSYKTFPMFGSYPTYAEFVCRPIDETATNKVIEFGIGIGPTTAAGVTDGVFFRYGTDGSLTGVLVANSVEAASAEITRPTTNQFHRYIIAMFATRVDFWIDDVLVATVTVPSLRGLPTNSYQGQVFARVWLSGVASAAPILDTALITVSSGDNELSRPWAVAMAGMGLHAGQTPTGALASGQSHVFANSAAPTAITALSNTALPTGPTHTNLLGGLFSLNLAALATAVADFILYAFLNPVGSATVPGRTLYITRVRIEGLIAVAGATGTATNLRWGLGFGSTALSLATTDGVAAKGPRRLPLGQWWLPAAAGATAGIQFPTIDVDFSGTPVPVNQSEYAHIIIGVGTALTAFTAGNITGSVLVNGFYE